MSESGKKVKGAIDKTASGAKKLADKVEEQVTEGVDKGRHAVEEAGKKVKQTAKKVERASKKS